MFTILTKNYIGRTYDRYFKSFDNAKKVLDDEVNSAISEMNGELKKAKDYMDTDKGRYIYYKVVEFPRHEICIWSLIDGYFEDE